MYELLIKYDQTQVLCETYAKMNHGYRLHYGNHLDQRLMVRIDEPKRSELILDFEREPITLPEPSFTVSSSLATVLKNTDAGVVLKADDKFQLFGKRLCQSRVFAFSSFAASEQTSTPIKMDREKEISLFSYQKFLESWYACLQHKTALPDHTVYLSFGKMPQERSSKVFISAKLIPKAAESLKTALESQRDWSEVLVSSEKSIDKTIRLGELLNWNRAWVCRIDQKVNLAPGTCAKQSARRNRKPSFYVLSGSVAQRNGTAQKFVGRACTHTTCAIYVLLMRVTLRCFLDEGVATLDVAVWFIELRGHYELTVALACVLGLEFRA